MNESRFVNAKYLLASMIFINVMIFVTGLAYAASASVVTGSGAESNLYFTGDSTSPKTWYQDAMDGNPDLGLRICGVGQKYVGGAYAMNVNGNWQYALITYRSASDALSFADIDEGGGCYRVTPGYLTFSPSYMNGGNPYTYYAAFPGVVWVAYADSPNPGTLTNFIRTDQKLLGSYNVHRSFHQSTGKIEIDAPSIIFQSQAAQITKNVNDPTFGVNDQRRMIVGVCNDQYGASCSDGQVISDPTVFPLQLDPRASPIDDHHTYTRYIVVNGIGDDMCIGANLKVAITSVQPNPVYYSQILNISFVVTNPRDVPYEKNGGNVDVTDTFSVEVKIYPQGNPADVKFDKILNFDGVPVDGSVTGNVHWNATAHSGTYVVEVDVDPTNQIAECNENDNSATQTFELKPIILPTIYINGVRSSTFPHIGIPYNLTMQLNNSDNETVSNATVIITEINGISPFVPTQIWNRTVDSSGNTEKTGTVVNTTARLMTDYNGVVSLTIIPTGNPIYSPAYAYLNPNTVLGDYNVSFTGVAYNGEPFVFVRNGVVYHQYAFHITTKYDYTYDYNSTTAPSLPNRGSIVDMILNTVYTIFSKFWKAVTL